MSTITSHQSQLDWLSIRLAPQMTRARFYVLMQHFKTPEQVFGASAREIEKLRGFDAEIAAALLQNFNTDVAQSHLDKMLWAGVSLMTRDCPDYPFGLAHSSLAPPLLFVKGQLAPEDKYSVAMVGSRHATTYGRAVARELSGALARYGLTIISGFARGIDGEAHHAAVKAGGRTIAVLGNGIDICYPSEHRSLVEMVATNGALISEYPLGTTPDRYNFPERNHVIAALALGTIVVEAAEKSGSLITARLALDENRFIFAVPGDITRNNSRGANSLIQSGARMVQRPQDVLIEMKDMLRGYLEIDQEGELIAAPAAPAETQAAPDKSKAEAAPAADAKPSASNSGTATGGQSARNDKSRDWVDDLAGLNDAELEAMSARLQTDDRKTENLLTAKIPLTRQTPPADTGPAELLRTVSMESLTDKPDKSAAPVIETPTPAVAANQTIAGASSAAATGTKQSGTNGAKPKLNEEEQFIIDLLHHEAMVFDELADRAFGRGIDVPRLTSLLMKLELKRVIRQLPGRYYVLFG